MTTEEKEKIIRQYTCEKSVNVIKGLFDLDPDKDTYDIFHDSFNCRNNHKIVDYINFCDNIDNPKYSLDQPTRRLGLESYREREPSTYSFERHLEAIQKVVKLLDMLHPKNSKFKDFFLHSVYDWNVNTDTTPYGFRVAKIEFKLEFELKFWNTEPKEAKNISKTRASILNAINAIDKNQGWEYVFKTQQDFDTFVDLLTCYFEYKDYTIPQQLIELKRGCKTRLAKTLNPIYKDLGNENKNLKSDNDFFGIVRVLSFFKKMTDAEIYQAITR